MTDRNLPPGVTDSMIPGNRPEDEAYEKMLDSEVGDLLFELAKMSLPDIAEVCRVCGRFVDREGDGWIHLTSDGRYIYEAHAVIAYSVPWPPYDVLPEIVNALRKTKDELGSYRRAY